MHNKFPQEGFLVWVKGRFVVFWTKRGVALIVMNASTITKAYKRKIWGAQFYNGCLLNRGSEHRVLCSQPWQNVLDVSFPLQ